MKHANNTSNRCLELSWCQMTKWSNITWWVTLSFQLHSWTSQRGTNRKHWPWRRVAASKPRLNQGRHLVLVSPQCTNEMSWQAQPTDIHETYYFCMTHQLFIFRDSYCFFAAIVLLNLIMMFGYVWFAGRALAMRSRSIQNQNAANLGKPYQCTIGQG